MNKLILFLALSLTFVGCATKTITAGQEFDAAKISRIQKGVTTADELKRLLGRPFTTSVQGDAVVWNYYWKKGKATTTQSSDGPVVTSQGEKKTLEVWIRNGVVVDFTYKDDPFWNEQLKASP